MCISTLTQNIDAVIASSGGGSVGGGGLHAYHCCETLCRFLQLYLKIACLVACGVYHLVSAYSQ